MLEYHVVCALYLRELRGRRKGYATSEIEVGKNSDPKSQQLVYNFEILNITPPSSLTEHVGFMRKGKPLLLLVVVAAVQF